MTVDAEELKQIMGEAEKEKKSSETDGFLRVGKIVLPEELPIFDDEFYKWKREYWANQIREKNIKYMVAPMVDQSELAFRMYMHRHNGHLFFTPMIHAHLFVTNMTYRRTAFSSVPEDRPLVVQFCANDPDIFLDACRLVEGFCDGVDLNLGCPQMVAKRGHYGSYLQDEPDLVAEMVSKVYKHCRLPLSVKIRVFEDLKTTIDYAKIIEKSGASMLTVHGRMREQKGQNTGIANWDKIRHVCEALTIPVVANGNLQMPGDADRCLQETGAVAVMSAEGLLSNPLLFENRIRPFYEIAKEYLEFAEKYKAPMCSIRAHLFRFCHHALTDHPDCRPKIGYTSDIQEFQQIVDEIRQKYNEQIKDVDGMTFLDGTEETLIDMVDKIPSYYAKPYVRPSQRTADQQEPLNEKKNERREELKKIRAETGLSFKQIRKRERRNITMQRVKNAKHVYPICYRCGQPAGVNCSNDACRKCCRSTCIRSDKECTSHQFTNATIGAKRARYMENLAQQEAEQDAQAEETMNNESTEQVLIEKIAG